VGVAYGVPPSSLTRASSFSGMAAVSIIVLAVLTIFDGWKRRCSGVRQRSNRVGMACMRFKMGWKQRAMNQG